MWQLKVILFVYQISKCVCRVGPKKYSLPSVIYPFHPALIVPAVESIQKRMVGIRRKSSPLALVTVSQLYVFIPILTISRAGNNSLKETF